MKHLGPLAVLSVLPLLSCCGGGGCGSITGQENDSSYPHSTTFTGATFDFAGITRAATGSDLWGMTWGADDRIYTAWGDGGGFGGGNERCRTGTGVASITGSADSYAVANLSGCRADGAGCKPKFTHSPDCDARYASAFDCCPDDIIAIDTTLYIIRNRKENDPPATGIAFSTDSAQSWEEYPWSWPRNGANDWIPGGFVHFGKANGNARDGYAYLSGNSTGKSGTYLARVPKGSLGIQAAYEWYASTDPSTPAWGPWQDAKPIHDDRKNSGGGCHMYYLPAQERYLLLQNFGTQPLLKNFAIYDAPEPWGPWTTVYITRNWGVGATTEEALWVNIIEKWTSPDGKTLYLSFSGYGDFDRFHLIRMDLQTAGSADNQTVPPA